MAEDTEIRINQLPTVEALNDSALLPIEQPSGDTYPTTKASMAQVAEAVVNTFEYAELETESKTIVDAINEAAQGGGNVDFEESEIIDIPTRELPYYPSGEYSGLTTSDKHIVGAINEVNTKATSAKTRTDALAPVNISSQIQANSAFIDTTKQLEMYAIKSGNVVQVHLTFIVKVAVSTGQNVLFTGLPQAVKNSQVIGINVVSPNAPTVTPFLIGEDGGFKGRWYAGQLNAGDTIRIGFTYICKD